MCVTRTLSLTTSSLSFQPSPFGLQSSWLAFLRLCNAYSMLWSFRKSFTLGSFYPVLQRISSMHQKTSSARACEIWRHTNRDRLIQCHKKEVEFMLLVMMMMTGSSCFQLPYGAFLRKKDEPLGPLLTLLHPFGFIKVDFPCRKKEPYPKKTRMQYL